MLNFHMNCMGYRLIQQVFKDAFVFCVNMLVIIVSNRYTFFYKKISQSMNCQDIINYHLGLLLTPLYCLLVTTSHFNDCE